MALHKTTTTRVPLQTQISWLNGFFRLHCQGNSLLQIYRELSEQFAENTDTAKLNHRIFYQVQQGEPIKKAICTRSLLAGEVTPCISSKVLLLWSMLAAVKSIFSQQASGQDGLSGKVISNRSVFYWDVQCLTCDERYDFNSIRSIELGLIFQQIVLHGGTENEYQFIVEQKTYVLSDTELRLETEDDWKLIQDARTAFDLKSPVRDDAGDMHFLLLLKDMENVKKGPLHRARLSTKNHTDPFCTWTISPERLTNLYRVLAYYSGFVSTSDFSQGNFSVAARETDSDSVQHYQIHWNREASESLEITIRKDMG